MGTKQKIIEALENKRTERVWELIENAIKEIYKEKFEIPETTKEEYLENEGQINNEKNRYIIVEDYNIEDGFYGRFYSEKENFEQMLDDYFSDCSGETAQILLVDMKEMKCYLLDREVKYSKKEVKNEKNNCKRNKL